jgi:uncharacterized protein YegL
MTIQINEFADNPEPRCPCLILADTSLSMMGASVGELNKGIEVLRDELRADPLASLRVEVGIVGFGGSAKTVQDFVTVDQFDPPKLSAWGGTPMGGAIAEGLKLLDARKAEYRAGGILYYRPWIFLITDGEPTDEWQSAVHSVHQGEADKKFSFFAVGVEEANMEILAQIAPPTRPPVKLQGLAFGKLFQWLSVSMRRMAWSQGSGQQVALDPIDSWAAARS